MLVSIVIPCRNEAAYIEGCLRSVLAFELPADTDFEVLVVDGQSQDHTRDIVRSLAREDPRIRLLENPRIIQAAAINLGIREARGEWILRLDAHASFPTDYLRLCLDTALRTGADNVGGLFLTRPGADSYSARLVQALTTHPFGVGDSGFRTGAREGPADTVPYGFLHRTTFDRVGMLDERLARNEDYEFNRRLAAKGGSVFLNPAIRIHYYNQPTISAFLRKQFHQEGPYNAYTWYVAPYAFTPRHAIAGVFVAGLVGGALLEPFSAWLALAYFSVLVTYGGLAILSGLQQAVRYREPLHAIALPPSFLAFHCAYGAGIIAGLARLLRGTAPVQGNAPLRPATTVGQPGPAGRQDIGLGS